MRLWGDWTGTAGGSQAQSCKTLVSWADNFWEISRVYVANRRCDFDPTQNHMSWLQWCLHEARLNTDRPELIFTFQLFRYGHCYFKIRVNGLSALTIREELFHVDLAPMSFKQCVECEPWKYRSLFSAGLLFVRIGARRTGWRNWQWGAKMSMQRKYTKTDICMRSESGRTILIGWC